MSVEDHRHEPRESRAQDWDRVDPDPRFARARSANHDAWRDGEQAAARDPYPHPNPHPSLEPDFAAWRRGGAEPGLDPYSADREPDFREHHDRSQAERREPGFGAEPSERWRRDDDDFDTPSLEEAFGLSERRPRRRAGARPARGVFERIASGVGRALLGGDDDDEGAGARGPRRPRRYWFSSFWGWRGAWPLLIGVALGAGSAAAPPVQRAVGDGVERMRVAMLSRPEFAIRQLEVTGMRNLSERDLKIAIRSLGPERAALAFDYEGARKSIEALGWVERASVVLQPPNTLDIEIVERKPAALWRRGDFLSLIDEGGVAVAQVEARAHYPELPLLVGAGASARVEEALRLARIAKAGGMSVAAMTRVGDRRWDLELSGGPRLMLPEHESQAALEQAVTLARDVALLERGFEVVDFRLPFAPTVRPRPLTAELAVQPAGGAPGAVVTGDASSAAR